MRAAARHFHRAATLRGLLEPDAVRAARPVLRGRGRSNAPALPAKAVYMAKGASKLAALGLEGQEVTDEYRCTTADAFD